MNDATDRRDRCHPSDGGRVRLMAQADGYVMARRPGAVPFCLPVKEWQGWQLYSLATSGDKR